MGMLMDLEQCKDISLIVRNLPAGATFHADFGIVNYSDVETLKRRFHPTKFDDLTDRELQIVPGSSVGAGYEYRNGLSGKAQVDLGYNVVISFPKKA